MLYLGHHEKRYIDEDLYPDCLFLLRFMTLVLTLKQCPMKNVLLILLMMIAAVMIYLGYKGGIWPPALTGIGFFIIAFYLYQPVRTS